MLACVEHKEECMHRNCLVLFFVVNLVGCASLESMYPKERPATDIKEVDSNKEFSLASPLSFQARNRYGQIVLKNGRYRLTMSDANGEYYQGAINGIELKAAAGGSDFITGGVFVPNDKARLCLVYYIQSLTPALQAKGAIANSMTNELTGTTDVKFYTWIEKDVMVIPICNQSK
jgi:hypothetical protein